MESNLVLTLSFIVYSAGIIAFGLYSTRMRKKTEDDFVLAFAVVLVVSILTSPTVHKRTLKTP
jgi:Na+/proline symporter